MANPELIDCPADTWLLVAAGVTSGNIYRKSTKPGGYLQTYRMAGDPPPADSPDEGVQAFDTTDIAYVESIEPIDVYLRAQKQAGRVRVDI
jgi:hypothetical protein